MCFVNVSCVRYQCRYFTFDKFSNYIKFARVRGVLVIRYRYRVPVQFAEKPRVENRVMLPL
jgi:hypothetical protein